MFTDALPEFRADWLLAGKASTTVDFYVSLLHLLGGEITSPDLLQAKAWVGDAVTVPMRRKRAQAVRAFGRWSESIGDNDFPGGRTCRYPPRQRSRSQQPPQPISTLVSAFFRLIGIVQCSQCCGAVDFAARR